MNRISKMTKITVLISICLWVIGSFFLIQESNGKTVILITAIIIIAGIYSQINKDKKAHSEL